MTETFGIRADYHVNPPASSSDYWSQTRIEGAAHYQHAVYRYAGRLIARRGCRRVIDVGCGVGTKLASLATIHADVAFVGIDRPAAIDICRSRHPCGEWLPADLDDPTQVLDVARAELLIYADVIEHLANPDVLLTTLRRWLSPDGVIVLSTPERTRLRGAACRQSLNPAHVREWSFAELATYVTSRSFTLVEHFTVLPTRLGRNWQGWRQCARQLASGRSPWCQQVCVLEAR